MKPDWKDAPEWARWLTYDLGGWYWHEDEPGWDEDFPGFFEVPTYEGRTQDAGQVHPSPGQFIKEPRP